MTRDELLALPATTDVVTAGRAWGLSRNQAYELAARDVFPCPVRRIGSRYRVVTEQLLASLGIERPAPDMSEDPAPTGSLATAIDTHGGTREHDTYEGRPHPALRAAG